MVRLTRINSQPIILNSDLVSHLESTPDTVITLTSGHKFVVMETPEEVVKLIVDFRRSLLEQRSQCEFQELPG